MKKTPTASLLTLSATLVAVAAPEPASSPAPAPVPATVGEAAPTAPLFDAIMQYNPAAPGTLGSVNSIPHRWAGKRVVLFEWNDSLTLQGAVDNVFFGMRLRKENGDFTAGYMTKGWALGGTVNLAKSSTDDGTTTTDSTFSPDGLDLIGSMNLDPYHLFGNLTWRNQADNGTVEASGTTTKSRYDSLALAVGLRTYVAGREGFAWWTRFTLSDIRSRPSGSDEAEARLAAELRGRMGYRFTSAGGSNLALGGDSWIAYLDDREDPDIQLTVGVRPNAVAALPIFTNWTVITGAGMDLYWRTRDDAAGSATSTTSTLLSAAPTGRIGVRYARDNWSAQAGVTSDFLRKGPYFLSGNDSASLVSFSLTANFK